MYQSYKLKTTLLIDSIISIHYFTFAKNYKYHGESHDFYELVIIDSGEMIVVDEENEYILAQDEAIIHAKNHFHNLISNHKLANVIIFSFECDSELLNNIVSKPFIISPYIKSTIKSILHQTKRGFLDPLNVVELEKMSSNPLAPIGSEQIIKNNLEILLLKIIQENSFNIDISEESLSKSNILISKISTYLHQHLEENISLATLSQEFGYSKSYLKQIFATAGLMPIIHYFNALKIERAKILISEGELNINEIADKLSFSSLQYFSRTFKLYSNMSPSSYKKSVESSNII